MSFIMKYSKLFLTLIVVALGITGAAISLTRIPPISQQLQDVSGNLAVSLKKPVNNSQWHPYTPIPVSADAFGSQPIQSLELWADGVKVETKNAPSGSASWTWTIPSPGEHILVVRAQDTRGRMVNSNVVRVIGSDDVNPGMVFVYSAQNGDTLAKVASKFNATPQQIGDLNPGLNLNSPISTGSPVKVPIGMPPPPAASQPLSPSAPSGQGQPPSLNLPNPFVFWLTQFTVRAAPQAPKLEGSVNNCSPSLFITDQSNNESGFNIYRLDPNQPVYKVIKTIGANGDTSKPIQVDDGKLSGSFSYYVSAFNAKGESASNIVNLNIKELSCSSSFWAGQQLGNAAPQNPITPIGNPGEITKFDKTYFYYSTDGTNWGRIPQNPYAFSAGGLFNLDEAVKQVNLPVGQGQITVTIDAWGWSGGNLIHIGRFYRTIGAPNTPPNSYNASHLQVCDLPSCVGDIPYFETDPVGGPEFVKWDFKWTPASSLQTNGLAQVSVVPFENTCDVNPAGIVWTTNLKSAGYNADTYFTIDFAQLKDKSAPINGWYVSGSQFYIRVIPMLGDQVICQPSNTVKWSQITPAAIQFPTALPKAPAPPPAYNAKIVSFTPVQFPDSTYQYCVDVISNPYYNPAYAADPQAYAQAIANSVFSGVDPNTVAWGIYNVGDMVCPTQYVPQEPSFWEQVGNWIVDAVDEIANLYNDLKAFVVDLAAKLNPLCIQANLAAQAIGSGQGTVEDVCHKIAEATVDVALAYAGLPPSLPNFKELVNEGKGYIADMAVEEMGEYCPDKDACKKVVEEGIDQVVAQIQQSQNNSSCLDEDTAHANGFEPLCAPAGVITAPAHKGQLVPAIVTIQVSRDPNIPDSAFPDPSQFQTSCNFSIGVGAKNDSWIGQQIVVGLDTVSGTQPIYWTGTEITGAPFYGVQSKMPAMQPGDSVQLAFPLRPNSSEFPPDSGAGFWLPGHLSNDYDWDLIEQFPIHDHDDWRYLYFGSTLTINLSGGCTTTGSGYQPNSTTFNDQLIQTIPSAGQ